MRNPDEKHLWLVICFLLVLAGNAEASTVRVNIDATLLTEQHFVIDSQGSAFMTKAIHGVDLVPGVHYFVTSGNTAGPSAAPFTVTAGGTIDYGPEYDTIFGGRGDSTLRVMGVKIHINASALSYETVSADGIVAFPPAQISMLTLMPGKHEILCSGNTAGPNYFYFTVSRSGEVDYAPENDAFMSGRGTSTLILNGWKIQVDATALSYRDVAISGSSWLSPSQVIPRTLMPGNHDFNGPSNTAGYNYVYFRVRPDGRVDYGLEWDGVLEGRGTPTLSVRGRRVTINARAIGNPSISVNGLGWRDSCEVLALTLIPGLHDLNAPNDNYNYVYFTLERSGTITYDPSMNQLLAGRGTATLLLRGVVVLLDASNFPDDNISVNHWNRLPARHVQPVVLMPGRHAIRRSGASGGPYTFEVTNAGSVNPNDTRLGVLGTDTLRLLQ